MNSITYLDSVLSRSLSSSRRTSGSSSPTGEGSGSGGRRSVSSHLHHLNRRSSEIVLPRPLGSESGLIGSGFGSVSAHGKSASEGDDIDRRRLRRTGSTPAPGMRNRRGPRWAALWGLSWLDVDADADPMERDGHGDGARPNRRRVSQGDSVRPQLSETEREDVVDFEGCEEDEMLSMALGTGRNSARATPVLEQRPLVGVNPTPEIRQGPPNGDYFCATGVEGPVNAAERQEEQGASQAPGTPELGGAVTQAEEKAGPSSGASAGAPSAIPEPGPSSSSAPLSPSSSAIPLDEAPPYSAPSPPSLSRSNSRRSSTARTASSGSLSGSGFASASTSASASGSASGLGSAVENQGGAPPRRRRFSPSRIVRRALSSLRRALLTILLYPLVLVGWKRKGKRAVRRRESEERLVAVGVEVDVGDEKDETADEGTGVYGPMDAGAGSTDTLVDEDTKSTTAGTTTLEPRSRRSSKLRFTSPDWLEAQGRSAKEIRPRPPTPQPTAEELARLAGAEDQPANKERVASGQEVGGKKEEGRTQEESEKEGVTPSTPTMAQVQTQTQTTPTRSLLLPNPEPVNPLLSHDRKAKPVGHPEELGGGGGGSGTMVRYAQSPAGKGHLFASSAAAAAAAAASASSAVPRGPSSVIHHSPKTLVLDLDETLIHSTSRSPTWGAVRGRTARGVAVSSGGNLLGLEGLGSMLGLRGSTAGRVRPHMVEVVLDGRSVLYHVYKRPWVDYFLRKVSRVVASFSGLSPSPPLPASLLTLSFTYASDCVRRLLDRYRPGTTS